MKKLKAVLTIIALVVFVATGVALASSKLEGTVIETMDSGGYSYVQIEKDGAKTWLAVPKTKVVKGETMTFKGGMPMKNFKSKTLDRTFDVIYFSPGIAQ